VSDTPDWWPDWRDETVAIIASGPSIKVTKPKFLRGRLRVIAIKENWDLCPWADIVYGCDGAWWKNNNGLPQFKGLKISYERAKLIDYPDIRIIDVEKECDHLLMKKLGVVGSGGNSGFQALNLAVQFGVARIMLVGFDMHGRQGLHWYGYNNGPGRNNPTEDNFRRWRVAFINAAPRLKDLGIDVVNISPTSDLECFRRLTMQQALTEWQL